MQYGLCGCVHHTSVQRARVCVRVRALTFLEEMCHQLSVVWKSIYEWGRDSFYLTTGSGLVPALEEPSFKSFLAAGSV